MTNIETDTRKKYSDRSIYDPSRITTSLFQSADNFSARLVAEKTKLLLELVPGRFVLDLGCANGRHLAELAPHIKFGIGVDFSAPFVKFAATTYNKLENVRFVVGNAREIPLGAQTVEVAYSLATMYHIDQADDVFLDLARVLKPGGIAMLELGNAHSLATLVSHHYPDIARHSRRTIREHLSSLRRSGFSIISWRSFQILPMWGDRPRWLQPLRTPALERWVTHSYRERMFDEWISSLPGIRRIAFRHLVVCKRI